MKAALGLAIAACGCGRVAFDALDDGAPITRARSTLTVAGPAQPVADFPLLVVLDDVRAARDAMQADGSDVRFYDDGGGVLAHEIEQVGAQGGAPFVAWVRVPTIGPAGTTLTVEYGGPPRATSSESVWSTTYAAVWHLVDTHDSTTNHHDGVWLGSSGPTTSPGLAGGCVILNATMQEAIEVADTADLDFGTAFTASGWMKPTDVNESLYIALIAREQNGANNDFWLGLLAAAPSSSLAATTYTQLNGTTVGTSNTWLAYALVYDGAVLTLYANGSVDGTNATTGPMEHTPYAILLGADRDNTGGADSDFLTGGLDEVRLEHVARPANWIAYDRRSQLDQLVTYGPVTR